MLTFLQLVQSIQHQVSRYSWQQALPFLNQPDKALLIDIREDREWLMGTIPGAHHLARGVLELKIYNYTKDADRVIFLFCGGGHRSILAAAMLTNMGFLQVHSIDGGIGAWTGELIQP